MELITLLAIRVCLAVWILVWLDFAAHGKVRG
jgi:hypothetical protein